MIGVACDWKMYRMLQLRECGGERLNAQTNATVGFGFATGRASTAADRLQVIDVLNPWFRGGARSPPRVRLGPEALSVW
jgi:hypothetical protein